MKINENSPLEVIADLVLDCASICDDLQEVLSPLLSNQHLSPDALSRIQRLDKLGQHLYDLSKITRACHLHMTCEAILHARTLQKYAKLKEVQDEFLYPKKKTIQPSELDLF